VLQASAIEGLKRLGDMKFDCIIMCSFLEHEISPKPLLRLCHECLAAAGCIIIKVPNYASWNRKIRRNRWCGFRYPDHVNYFTPSTLKKMLEDTGFKIIRMNFFDRIPTSDSLWAVAAKANQ
jgi:predicted SAM-dependent methyltransferase